MTVTREPSANCTPSSGTIAPPRTRAVNTCMDIVYPRGAPAATIRGLAAVSMDLRPALERASAPCGPATRSCRSRSSSPTACSASGSAARSSPTPATWPSTSCWPTSWPGGWPRRACCARDAHDCPRTWAWRCFLSAIHGAVAHPDTPAYLRAARETAGFAPAALRTIEDLAAAQLPPESLENRSRGGGRPAAAPPRGPSLAGFESGLAKASLLDHASLYGGGADLPSPLVGAVVLCGSTTCRPPRWSISRGARQPPPARDLRPTASIASAPRHASRQQAFLQRLGARVSAPEAGVRRGESRRDRAPAAAGPALRPERAQRATTTTTEGEAALDARVQVLSAAGEALEAVGDRQAHPASRPRGRAVPGDRRPPAQPRRPTASPSLRLSSAPASTPSSSRAFPASTPRRAACRCCSISWAPTSTAAA